MPPQGGTSWAASANAENSACLSLTVRMHPPTARTNKQQATTATTPTTATKKSSTVTCNCSSCSSSEQQIATARETNNCNCHKPTASNRPTDQPQTATITNQLATNCHRANEQRRRRRHLLVNMFKTRRQHIHPKLHAILYSNS